MSVHEFGLRQSERLETDWEPWACFVCGGNSTRPRHASVTACRECARRAVLEREGAPPRTLLPSDVDASQRFLRPSQPSADRWPPSVRSLF